MLQAMHEMDRFCTREVFRNGGASVPASRVTDRSFPISPARGDARPTQEEFQTRWIALGHLFPESSDHSMEGNTASLEFCFIFGVD
jgi:hypothetical protein